MVSSTSGTSGLALAGGAALIVQGFVDRTTRDLDYFAMSPRTVEQATRAIEETMGCHGLVVTRVLVNRGFARLLITYGTEECRVDIGCDSRLLPPVAGPLGLVLAPDELAADKVLALFDRAEARDFADTYALAAIHGRDRLLELAALKDSGFDRLIFAERLGSIARFDRQEFEIDDDTLERLTRFFADWRRALSS